MRLGFGLGVTAPSVLARVSAVAEFTMTQLPKVNRNYQRTSSTGGGQGKGSGTIPVQVNVTTAGPIFRRIRSQADDSILQAAALVTNANAGAQSLQVPADVRLGWFFVDLAPTANGPWTLGTTRVGMGGASLWTGQSQMSRSIGRTSGASGTLASNGITVSPYGTVYATYADTRTVTSPAWAVPADGSNYDATAVAEFLRLKIEAEGCNWSVIGHSVGGSTINGWQPGNTHFNNLLPILAEEGGFEEWWSYLGGTDAGAGTTGAAYKTGLTNVFNELVNRNLLRGSNFRKYIAVAGTRLAGGDGTAAQVTALRVAGKEWAAENGGIYLEPHDITLLDDVHQDQAGGVTLARHLYRAMTTSDVGPTITGGTRSGTVITMPVQHVSGATALVRSGNPGGRFAVYTAGTLTSALALASTDPVVVSANSITLNLAADPGNAAALDVYALRHPDPSGTTAQSSMVYDNRNPEGFANGRHLQPTHTPVQIAAPGGSGSPVAPDAPTISAAPGNTQNTISFTDGASNGGATISARPLYRSTTQGFTPSSGNLVAANPTYPYVDSGLTNGTTYYYRAGATNTAGTTLSGEVSAVPTAGAVTGGLNDTFTDSDGVALSAHTGESGHTWSTTNGNDATIRNGRVIPNAVACNLLSSYVPTDVVQTIVAEMVAVSALAQNTLVRFRIQSDTTYYYAGKVNPSTNKWVIGYTINGTTNNAAISTADIPNTVGANYTVRVEDAGVGGVIRLFINDVQVAQFTDNQAALNTKGRVGLRYSLAGISQTTGMQVTSLRVTSPTPADTTAPTVTSSPSGTTPENQAYSTTLTANEPVSWSLRSGDDTAQFSLSGATLSLPAKNFEAPTDDGANNTYVARLRATDAAGNFTDFAHTVAVTDVAEGSAPQLATATSSSGASEPEIIGVPEGGQNWRFSLGRWNPDYPVDSFEMRLETVEATPVVLIPWGAPQDSGSIPDQVGNTLRLRVRATNANGTTEAVSASFGPIGPAGDVLVLAFAFNTVGGIVSDSPFSIEEIVAQDNVALGAEYLYVPDRAAPTTGPVNTNPGMEGLRWGVGGGNIAAAVIRPVNTPQSDRLRGRWGGNVQPSSFWCAIEVPEIGVPYKLYIGTRVSSSAVVTHYGLRDGANNGPIFPNVPAPGSAQTAQQVRDAAGNVITPEQWLGTAASDNTFADAKMAGTYIEFTPTTNVVYLSGYTAGTPHINFGAIFKKAVA